MSKQSQLHQNLKQLSHDIRELVDLAMLESSESWEKMIETVKNEVSEELIQQDQSKGKSEGVVYSTLISEIYDHLGMLMKNIKVSQDRLRKLATRDLLTGLYNRNYFNETIIRDIQKARRYHEKLSMILIDIDNFKYINDTFGHLHGDGVIKECANILSRSVRRSDFLCRYGGDEFVIVTPKPDCKDNDPLLERIKEQLDKWNSQYATADYTLSFSIGCASWNEEKDIMDVLHEADQNMYQDKQRKRN
jgi:diguanylate cyclase (GGDEF)-like protein